jgi:hypothetical protein
VTFQKHLEAAERIWRRRGPHPDNPGHGREESLSGQLLDSLTTLADEVDSDIEADRKQLADISERLARIEAELGITS